MPKAEQKGEQSSEGRQVAIKAALEAVHAGKSVRSAAQEFGIPYSILRHHCSELIKKIVNIQAT